MMIPFACCEYTSHNFPFHSGSLCKMSIAYVINESFVSLWRVALKQFINFGLFQMKSELWKLYNNLIIITISYIIINWDFFFSQCDVSLSLFSCDCSYWNHNSNLMVSSSQSKECPTRYPCFSLSLTCFFFFCKCLSYMLPMLLFHPFLLLWCECKKHAVWIVE